MKFSSFIRQEAPTDQKLPQRTAGANFDDASRLKLPDK